MPRISERELEEFINKLGGPAAIETISEEQVYAIMGEPMRRKPPVTMTGADGQVVTIYQVFWKEPGSSFQSAIGFVDGRVASMMLGAEFTP